jgi:multidrug resistance efflux pump
MGRPQWREEFMTNRRWQIYALVGVALLTVSAGGTALLVNGPRTGAAHGASDKAAAEPLPRVICFGHVDIEEGVASLYPLVSGRVVSVAVKENQPVNAGTVLFRLDDTLARLRLKEAEADLVAAREQLEQAQKLNEQQRLKVAQQKAAIASIEQKLAAARELRDRKRELEKNMQINPRDVRVAEALVKELEAVEEAESKKLQELNLNDPNATIRRSQAEVDAKESRREQAQRGVEECELKAPSDGMVLRVLTHTGEVLGPQPRQPAVLFCPKGPRIVRAEIEQEFAGRVEVGQAASIQDDTTSSPTWHGKVMRVSDWYTHRRSVLQEPFQFNDVRTLECIVAIDAGQPPLRIGQRVRVTLGQGQ